MVLLGFLCYGQNKVKTIAKIKQSFSPGVDEKTISQWEPSVLIVRSFYNSGFFHKPKIRYIDTIAKVGDTAILKKYDYDNAGKSVEILTVKKWVNNILKFNQQYEIKNGHWHPFMIDTMYFDEKGVPEKVETFYNGRLYEESKYTYSVDSTVFVGSAEVNMWLPVINIYFKSEELARRSVLLNDAKAIYHKWDLNSLFLYVKEPGQSYDLTVNVQLNKKGFWTQFVQLYNYDIPNVQKRQTIVTERKVKIKSDFAANTDKDLLRVLAREVNFLHLPEYLYNEASILPIK